MRKGNLCAEKRVAGRTERASDYTKKIHLYAYKKKQEERIANSA